MTTPKPMPRSAWRKTPYAASEARDPDSSVRDLLRRYGVADIQVTETTGPNGRPMYVLRFRHRERVYRVGMEVLHAEAKPEELIRQVKRAVYYLLKSVLEYTSVFAPVEVMLFAFLETPTGPTLYELAAPSLGQLKAPDFGRLLLPPVPSGDQP